MGIIKDLLAKLFPFRLHGNWLSNHILVSGIFPCAVGDVSLIPYIVFDLRNLHRRHPNERMLP